MQETHDTATGTKITSYQLRGITPEFLAELLGDQANISHLKARETAKAIAFQHRYLQEEIIKFLISVLFWYAAENRGTDARNEWAVKFCQELLLKAEANQINAFPPQEAVRMVKDHQ